MAKKEFTECLAAESAGRVPPEMKKEIAKIIEALNGSKKMTKIRYYQVTFDRESNTGVVTIHELDRNGRAVSRINRLEANTFVKTLLSELRSMIEQQLPYAVKVSLAREFYE